MSNTPKGPEAPDTARARRRVPGGGVKDGRGSTQLPEPVNTAAALAGVTVSDGGGGGGAAVTTPIKKQRPGVPLPATPPRAGSLDAPASPAMFSPASQSFQQLLRQVNLMKRDAGLLADKFSRLKSVVGGKDPEQLLSHRQDLLDVLALAGKLQTELPRVEEKLSPYTSQWEASYHSLLANNAELNRVKELRDTLLEMACRKFFERGELSFLLGNTEPTALVMSPEELNTMAIAVEVYNQRIEGLLEKSEPSEHSPFIRAHTPGQQNGLKQELSDARKAALVEKREEALSLLRNALGGWEQSDKLLAILESNIDELNLAAFESLAQIKVEDALKDINPQDSGQIGMTAVRINRQITVMLAVTASLGWFAKTICLNMAETVQKEKGARNKRDQNKTLTEKLEEAKVSDQIQTDILSVQEAFEAATAEVEQRKAEKEAIARQLEELERTVVTVDPERFQTRVTALAQLSSTDALRGLVLPVITAVSGSDKTTMPVWQVALAGADGYLANPELAKEVLGTVSRLDESDRVALFDAGLLGFVNSQVPTLMKSVTDVVAQAGDAEHRRDLLFVARSSIWELIYDAIKSKSTELFTLLKLVADLDPIDRVRVFTEALSSGNPLLFDVLKNYKGQKDNLWRVLQGLSPQERMTIWHVKNTEGAPLWIMLLENDFLFAEMLADIAALQSDDEKRAVLTALEQDQTFIWRVVSSSKQFAAQVMDIVANLQTAQQRLAVFMKADSAGKTFLHLLIENDPDQLRAFIDFVNEYLADGWEDLLSAADALGRNPLYAALEFHPQIFSLLLSQLTHCSREKKKEIFGQKVQVTKQVIERVIKDDEEVIRSKDVTITSDLLHRFVVAWSETYRHDPAYQALAEMLFAQLESIFDEGKRALDLIDILNTKNDDGKNAFYQALTIAPDLLQHFLDLVAQLPIPGQKYDFLITDKQTGSSFLGQAVNCCQSVVPRVLELMSSLESSKQLGMLTARVGLGEPVELEGGAAAADEAGESSIVEVESTLAHEVFAHHAQLRVHFVAALQKLEPEDRCRAFLVRGGAPQQLLVQTMIASDEETAKSAIAMISELSDEQQEQLRSEAAGNGDTWLMTVCQLKPQLMDLALATLEGKSTEDKLAYFTQPNRAGLYLFQLVLMHAARSVEVCFPHIAQQDDSAITAIFTQGSPTVFELILRKNSDMFMIPNNVKSLRGVMVFLSKRLNRQAMITLFLNEKLQHALLDVRVVEYVDPGTITALIAHADTPKEVKDFLLAQQRHVTEQSQFIMNAVAKITQLQALQTIYGEKGKKNCFVVCEKLVQLLGEIQDNGSLQLSQYVSRLELDRGLVMHLKESIWYKGVFRSAWNILNEFIQSFGISPRLRAMARDVTANANLVIEVAAYYPERLFDVLISDKGFEAFIHIIEHDYSTFSYLVRRICQVRQSMEAGVVADKLRQLMLRKTGRQNSFLKWVVHLASAEKIALLVDILKLFTADQLIECMGCQAGSANDDLIDFAVLVSNQETAGSVSLLLEMVVDAFKLSTQSSDLVGYCREKIRSAAKNNADLLPTIFNTLSPKLILQEWCHVLFDREQPLYFDPQVQSRLPVSLQMMAIHYLLSSDLPGHEAMLGQFFSMGDKKKAEFFDDETSVHYKAFKFLAGWVYYNSKNVSKELGVNAEIIRFNLHNGLLRLLEEWVGVCLSRGQMVSCTLTHGFERICRQLKEIAKDPDASGLFVRRSPLGHGVLSAFQNMFGMSKVVQSQLLPDNTFVNPGELLKPNLERDHHPETTQLDRMLRYVDFGRGKELAALLTQERGIIHINNHKFDPECDAKIRAILYAVPKEDRYRVLMAAVETEGPGDKTSWSLLSKSLRQNMGRSILLGLLLDLTVTLELEQQLSVFKQLDPHNKPLIANESVGKLMDDSWLLSLIEYAAQKGDADFLDALESCVMQQYKPLLMRYCAIAKVVVEWKRMPANWNDEDLGKSVLTKWVKRFSKVLEVCRSQPGQMPEKLQQEAEFIGAIRESNCSPEVKALLVRLKSRFLKTPLTEFISDLNALTFPVDELFNLGNALDVSAGGGAAAEVSEADPLPSLRPPTRSVGPDPLQMSVEFVRERLDVLTFIQWQLEAFAKNKQQPYQLTSCLSQVRKLVGLFEVWYGCVQLTAIKGSELPEEMMTGLQGIVRQSFSDRSLINSVMGKVSEILKNVAIDKLPAQAQGIVRQLKRQQQAQQRKEQFHASLWAPRGSHQQQPAMVPYANMAGVAGRRSMHAASFSGSPLRGRNASGSGGAARADRRRDPSQSVSGW